ncbi:MAG TPA: hypothetical protein VF017_20845 [Thermoanaerobaculia bacterium]|nr:hypothetical protein [Thermoanaerobaculia bacterium]
MSFPSPRPALRLLSRFAAVAALGWLGWGLGVELVRAEAVERKTRLWRMPATVWRFGQRQTELFRDFTLAAGRHVPPGERILFLGPADQPDTDFFGYLWASYHLADRTVVPSSHPQALEICSHVLVFGRKLEGDPRLELVWDDKLGALYRLTNRAAAP